MDCPSINRASTSNSIPFTRMEGNYKWSSESAYLFQKALCSNETINLVTKFMACKIPENVEGIEVASTKFNGIVISAANKSLMSIRTKHKSNHYKQNKKWFSSNLSKLRDNLKQAGRLVRHYPHDPLIRGNYYKLLKQYRKQCKT